MPKDAEYRGRRRKADTDLSAYARRYGDALRVADGAAAERLIDDALGAGVSPVRVQAHIIEPAMVRVGELWEAGVLSVADEHLATAISQRVMVRLFERLNVARARTRERILLAGTEGQHHVLGLRMVADVLEGAGFDVLYLGGDVPVQSLGRFAAAHQPEVTGLAYGVEYGVLAESIEAVHTECPTTRVMLGGRAVPAEFEQAGYPLVTSSLEVIAAVEKLLNRPPQVPSAKLRQLSAASAEVWSADRSDRSHRTTSDGLAEAAEAASDTARHYVRRANAFKDLAFRDPLTDLGNRRAFDEVMDTWAQKPRADGSGVLMMIDVDRFKSVNDQHGHVAGDLLLKKIASAIAAAVREDDFAARVGGDEFGVVLGNASLGEAHLVAGRIRHAIAQTAVPPVTVSIGLSSLSSDTRMALLSADTALYDAKALGRDRVSDATVRSC